MIQRKYPILFSLLGVLISMDQLTKLTVLKLVDYGSHEVIVANFFNIAPTYNYGAAFGYLSQIKSEGVFDLFLIPPLLVVLILLIIFHKLNDGQMKSVFALGFIIGGAMGNIIDRVRLGYVVDFLDFHWFSKAHFPAFNIADISIFVGSAILFLTAIFDKPKNKGNS